MANCRPAGLSDEDTDSDDDYGFFEKLDRNRSYPKYVENTKQKIEVKLQDAVINGDLEGIEKVISIDLNNDVNAKLESGWTPLLHACFHAQEDIVTYLLDRGANPNVHADSVTPVMMACSNSSANETATYNIVLSLIEKDCILNLGDKYGVTPLMRAAISGRTSVVELILDKDVNIEMRDHQGWTAIFWAIHHNHARCLDILLRKGARLNIVDRSNRTATQIAQSHEYEEIHSIIKQYTDSNKDVEGTDEKLAYKELLNKMTGWQDYYPGLRDENKPKYASEIPHLLYGMNCERLLKIFESNPVDLRTFLLLEDEDMVKLGIEMPYERQRLKNGLRGFHTRSWKVDAVAGLQARRREAYSNVECLNILGTHLQQLYILECTVTYILRDYNRIQNQIKFEPPDSPTVERLNNTAKKINSHINCIRREIRAMKNIQTKISKESLKPADLITEKSTKEVLLEIFSELVVIGSLGLLAYHAKSLMSNMLRK